MNTKPISRRAVTLLPGALAVAQTLAPLAARADTRTARAPLPAEAAAAPGAAGTSRGIYASKGAVMTHFDIDVLTGSLTARSTMTFPYAIQYAWPHPTRRILYVAWSKATTTDGPIGDQGVSTVLLDEAGRLDSVLGSPLLLRKRPVHLSVDPPAQYLLVAHNNPQATASVWALGTDGSVGTEVPQPGIVDGGFYAHQVRVDPTNKMAIMVTRGSPVRENPPSGQEDPGAIKVFQYDQGQLHNEISLPPGGKLYFNPRHCDFYLDRWVFVSIEEQQELRVYERVGAYDLSPTPLWIKSTMADPAHADQSLFPQQQASAVHISPDRRFVYVGNRNSSSTGENNIAVFSINPSTGEPTKIQNADAHGFVPRTFTFDVSAQLLIAANQSTGTVVDVDGASNTVPSNLAIFRILRDGTLRYLSKLEGAAGTWIGSFLAP
jgi:6-phosphogluconolactonase